MKQACFSKYATERAIQGPDTVQNLGVFRNKLGGRPRGLPEVEELVERRMIVGSIGIPKAPPMGSRSNLGEDRKPEAGLVSARISCLSLHPTSRVLDPYTTDNTLSTFPERFPRYMNMGAFGVSWAV
jgi:hypothetical protein